MTRFAINFDYLCPFAYIGNDLTIRALQDGADHEVEFLSFSLSQVHLEEGATPVWEAQPLASGVLALQWGLAVRDRFPESFHAAHLALFAARHDHGLNLSDPEVVRAAVAGAGLDPAEVEKAVAEGGPLRALAAEHTRTVEQHRTFGVPTFFAADRAVFVRLMRRAKDGPEARATLDRLLDTLIGWPELNEFKATRIPR